MWGLTGSWCIASETQHSMGVVRKVTLFFGQWEQIESQPYAYHFTLPVVFALARLVTIIFVSTERYPNLGSFCFLGSIGIVRAIE